MRTNYKQELAVALCMIFFHYTNRGISPAISALAAVFFFKNELETSFYFGKTRIFWKIQLRHYWQLLSFIPTATGQFHSFSEVIGVSVGQMLVTHYL